MAPTDSASRIRTKRLRCPNGTRRNPGVFQRKIATLRNRIDAMDRTLPPKVIRKRARSLMRRMNMCSRPKAVCSFGRRIATTGKCPPQK